MPIPRAANPAPLDRSSQAAVITGLIASDPEMQQLAREYVLLGLREMLNQLQRGDAQTRAAIAKSMSGAVTSLFTQSGPDDGLSDLRTEMHTMVAEMRGELMDREDDEGGGGLTDEERDEDAIIERHRVMVPKK